MWANALRDYETGKLAQSDKFWRFPQLNTMRLPFDSVPNATGAYVDPESLWSECQQPVVLSVNLTVEHGTILQGTILVKLNLKSSLTRTNFPF